MLYWIGIGIVVIIAAIGIAEFLGVLKILKNIAYAMVLLPFILTSMQLAYVAQMIKERNYFKLLRFSFVSIGMILVVGLLVILFEEPIVNRAF